MSYFYRTKTYVAGAWDEDNDAIEQLYKWNDSDAFALEFKNVHEYHQSYDSSFPCSIKQNLSMRMDKCKLFILIVGSKTNDVTRGACYNCTEYKYSRFYLNYICNSHKAISNKSFVDFECDKARRDYDSREIKILVLYNASIVDKNKCPESIRYRGVHEAMKTAGTWDYYKVKAAFERAKK